MSIYIVQICIILLVLIIALNLLRMASSLKKAHRIGRFSLDISKDNTSIISKITNNFYSILNSLSKGLSRYSFINKLSNKYDKYILEINRDKVSPVDYLTIKLLLVILGLSFCLIGLVLNILPANIFIFIIVFLASYFLPDLFWKYLYTKKIKRINNEIYLSTKYIYYGLSKNMTIEGAIKYAINNLDGDIVDELNKILRDIKHNISLEQAYLKFYQRSKIKEVLNIYEYLKIANLLNMNYIDTYKYIIKESTSNYETKEKTFKIIDIYNYLFLVVLLIPLLVFVFGIFINLDYFNKLMTGKGLSLVVIVIILYSIYIYIIKNILEVKDE